MNRHGPGLELLDFLAHDLGFLLQTHDLLLISADDLLLLLETLDKEILERDGDGVERSDGDI